MAQTMDVYVRAIVNAEGNIGKRMRDFSRSVTSSANAIVSDAGRSAAALGKMAAAAAGAAAGLLGRSVLKGGIEFNALIEEIRLGIASTLTLYDYLPSSVNEASSAQDKFNARVAEGEKISKRLVKIAAESPGEIQDVERMYGSLLPAVASFGASLEDSLKLTQQTAIMSALMGNNFDLAGRQVASIVKGGAGKAQRSFRLLSGPILEVAKTMPEVAKHFEGLNTGTREFTKAWNQALTDEQRMVILMKAMKNLGGPVAKAYAESWEGSTAAIKSSWSYLKKEFTAPLFDGLKGEFVKAVTGESLGTRMLGGLFGLGGDKGTGMLQKMSTAMGGGGTLNADSARYEKLLTMMRTMGHLVAKPIIGAVAAAFRFASYVADHWEELAPKIFKAFDHGLIVAKMLLAFKMTKFVAAGAVSGVSGLISGMMTFGRLGFSIFAVMNTYFGAMLGPMMGAMTAIVAMAPVALVAVVGFMAIGGALVLVAGAGAYFLENWNLMVKAISDGTVSIEPVFAAIDTLWAKFVAIGEVMLGAGSASEGAASMVSFVSDAIGWMTSVMGDFLGVALFVNDIWNYMTIGLKALGLAFAFIFEKLGGMISWIMSKLNLDTSDVDAETSRFREEKEKMLAGMRQDSADIDRNESIREAWKNAQAKGPSEFTKMLRKKFDDAVIDAAKKGKQGPPQEKAPKIDIHTLYANMDLRNQDPDRIVSVFWEDIAEKATRPLSSPAMLEHGI